MKNLRAFANNSKSSDNGPGDQPVRKTVRKEGGITVSEEEYTSTGGSGSAGKRPGRNWQGKKMGTSGSGGQGKGMSGSGTPGKLVGFKSKGGGSGEGGTPTGVTKIRRVMVEPIKGREIPKEPIKIKKKELPSASAGKNKVGKLTPSELARKQVATGKSAGQIAAEEAREGKGSTFVASGKSTNQKKMGIPSTNTSGGYSVQGSVRDKSGKKKQR